MSPKKEAPAESSGRRESRPWSPSEEDAARQRIRDEVAQGKPYVVLNLDSLVLEVLSAAIQEDAVSLLVSVEGEVVRPGKTAVVRVVQSVEFPATVTEDTVDAV